MIDLSTSEKRIEHAGECARREFPFLDWDRLRGLGLTDQEIQDGIAKQRADDAARRLRIACGGHPMYGGSVSDLWGKE